jgi:hypothetical protein
MTLEFPRSAATTYSIAPQGDEESLQGGMTSGPFYFPGAERLEVDRGQALTKLVE